MARSTHDKARATDGMHSALYFWYFLTVLVAGLAGGFIFGRQWAGPMWSLESFGWKGFAGFAIAAAVMGVPVMVFFSLGERILHEVMDINDAAHRAEPPPGAAPGLPFQG
ncbi:hypothetical protein [Demequina sp.]|uniref:hypothetical protein n=1 Tax=Demequina sp. TaxID=2050685 RepID=UPI0025BD1803|nr:hypothetical protein [Demequina sp.]